MIAGAGHPRADEPRNRSGDGAAAQRPAAARRPVAPGREGDRRRRLLGAELRRRRESPCDSGDGLSGPGRVREGCGPGAGENEGCGRGYRGLGTAFWRVLLPSSLRRCFASVSSLVDWKSK